MYKPLFILCFGILETFLFTWWNLSANKRQPYISSTLMFGYMVTYLFILDSVFKDENSKLMIVVYVMGCMVGNFLRIKWAIKNEKNKKL